MKVVAILLVFSHSFAHQGAGIADGS